MTEVALYLDLSSPPCRAVYFFAKASKIPFKNHVVQLAKGEHLTEEFGKLNPLRKVPAQGWRLFNGGEGMTPVITGHEAPPEKINAALSEFNTISTAIQDVFLQDKPFIGGDKVSIADVVAMTDIGQTRGADIDVFEDYPKLVAWRQRVQEAVGEELFKEGHEALSNLKETQLPPKVK